MLLAVPEDDPATVRPAPAAVAAAHRSRPWRCGSPPAAAPAAEQPTPNNDVRCTPVRCCACCACCMLAVLCTHVCEMCDSYLAPLLIFVHQGPHPLRRSDGHRSFVRPRLHDQRQVRFLQVGKCEVLGRSANDMQVRGRGGTGLPPSRSGSRARRTRLVRCE